MLKNEDSLMQTMTNMDEIIVFDDFDPQSNENLVAWQ